MSSRRPSAWLTLCAACTLLALWLFTHRYHGLRHDALFYAAQALARLDPAAFRQDLFFAFGSQDDYSLFSRPYALLIQHIGLGRATIALLLCAHAGWMLATGALARAWLRGTAFWIGLAVVFALPRDYGSSGDLHYAEPFLTARSWAEPLVIAAVAAQIAGRRLAAWAVALLAMLCHPIMALPALLFLALDSVRPGFRLLAVAGGVTLSASLLLPSIDADWLSIIRHRAPFLLLDTWQPSELLEPLTWIGLLAVSAQYGPDSLRRPSQSLAMTGLVCLALAILGTLTHATLLVQAQAWRGMWLTKVTGLLALTTLIATHWRRSVADRWLLAGLVAAAVTATTTGGPVALTLAGLIRVAWRNNTPPELPRWLPWAGGMALFAVAVETLLAVSQHLAFLITRIDSPSIGQDTGDLSAFFTGPLALLLPLGVWLLLRLTRYSTPVAAAVSGILLLISATRWDLDRDPYQLRATETRKPFHGQLSPGALVYWQHDFRAAWFLLRTGNYASIHQSVGVVFSRTTAMEAQRRLGVLAGIGASDGEIIPAPLNRRPSGHPPTQSDLENLCREPVLDYVILNTDALRSPQARWQAPDGRFWYLYACRRQH